MPKVNKGKTVVVELTVQEVRAAIEHAAWCAAVNADPSIAAIGEPITMMDQEGGYRVQYSLV